MPPLLPRLAALDHLRRVIYVGTFAKTLSASLRVGYVASDHVTAAALSDIKLLTTVATSDFVERLVHGLIIDGHYHRHLRRLRQRVQDATVDVLHKVTEAGLTVAQTNWGGFYLWGELPHHVDEVKLCREAAHEGIFLAPGNVFRPNQSSRPGALRINVAHGGHPRFLDFLKQALSSRTLDAKS